MQNRYLFLISEEDSLTKVLFENVFKHYYQVIEYKIVSGEKALLDYLKEYVFPIGTDALPPEKTEVSLIILNLNQLEKNGTEIVRSIRQEKNYRNIPIIGTSDTITDKMIDGFLKAGGDFVKIKPSTPYEYHLLVTDCITSVLKYHNLQKETRHQNTNL